ncbi:DUF4875 domain-containing protein [Shewanella sp.]|uniref:DUF4875 domain-containing protein n=1 Tax=Shewanella sp. TaxID=50422 RepID=UPI000EDC7C06|nr:DUF4875 domain-containing protein [Shewanella sp.]HCD15495.1 hypothetical protein [Shewanella sp.]
MDVFLFFATLFFLLALVVGLINPHLVRTTTRGQVLKFYGLGSLVLFILFGLLVDPVKPPSEAATVQAEQLPEVKAPIEQAPAVTKPVAHEYQVIAEENTSMPGRERLRWRIVAPTALTQLDRAETAKAAAKDLQEKTGADFTHIFLEAAEFTAGFGNVLAIVTYAPDGCGVTGKDCTGKKWEVSASATQLTDTQMAIWKAWIENREKFMPDGYVDEDRLKEFLAKKFDTAPDKITLPWVERDDIPQ